jgi:hypothetical protein
MGANELDQVDPPQADLSLSLSLSLSLDGSLSLSDSSLITVTMTKIPASFILQIQAYPWLAHLTAAWLPAN